MGNSDTIKLLKECDAGSKMADKSAKDICKRLISIEDELRRELYDSL